MTDYLLQALLFNMKVSATGCWEWTGYVASHGYGQLKVKGKRYRVHRLAYQLFVGDLDPELVIDHLCKNKRCFNPKHIEQVPQAENIRRALPARDQCPHGHLYDAKNTYHHPTRGHRMCRRCRADYRRRVRQRASV